jgi:hypothetical protein
MSNNFKESYGKEHFAHDTTAAEAQINAPNAVEAMHVSENAERAKDAANQAASVAKTLGSDLTGEPTTAVDQFKMDASRTTEAAVTEGKQDVQQATVVGVAYVEQAKSLANSALETAKNYLPTALGGNAHETGSTSQEAPSLIDQVKDTAANIYATAVSTAKPQTDKLGGTASAVTDAAQPHIDSTKETAQSTWDAAHGHIEAAKAAAKPHFDNAKVSAQAAVDAALPYIEGAKANVQGSMGVGANAVEGPGLTGQKIIESKSDIPSTSAPLESGPNTVKSPYPTTTTIPLAKDIASNEGSPMQTRN